MRVTQEEPALENFLITKSLINDVVEINNFINLIKNYLIREFISDLTKTIDYSLNSTICLTI